MPLLVYAVFGPSRVMVLGPDSSLAAVIAGIILPLGGRDPARAVALAGMLAILTGLMILLAGVARLGFVTELLSRPVQLGYLYGIAITIMVGQLPKLFGFSVDGTGLLSEAWGFVQGLARGETNRAALAVGLAGIAVILGLRRLWPGFPGVIVAVGLGIAAVAVFDLTEQGGPGHRGPAPGLPSFAFPDVRLADLPLLFGGALGIALVAVADTTVLSQSLATRRREVVDPNQELVALGAANLAAGLFHGFPISSSASRTPVAISAGARSQLTPLVGATAIVVLLVVAPGALRNLPQPILAAVVITAAIGLVDARAVGRLYRVRRPEFVLWLAAFGGWRCWGSWSGSWWRSCCRWATSCAGPGGPMTPCSAARTSSRATTTWNVIPTPARSPGCCCTGSTPRCSSPTPTTSGAASATWSPRPHPIRWVVVAAEPITDVDTTAADALLELLGELQHQEVVLAFAEMKGLVKDRLRRYGLYTQVGAERFFPTVGTAVDGYLRATGMEWVDWEERPDGPRNG